MWHRVVFVWTYISEDRIASIFRVEKSASKEPAWAVSWNDQLYKDRKGGRLSATVGTNFADMRRSLGQYSLLVD
jgi:hypothetical protein